MKLLPTTYVDMITIHNKLNGRRKLEAMEAMFFLFKGIPDQKLSPAFYLFPRLLFPLINLVYLLICLYGLIYYA